MESLLACMLWIDNTCAAGASTLHHCVCVCVLGGRKGSHTLQWQFENSLPVDNCIVFQPGDIFTSQTFWKGNPPLDAEIRPWLCAFALGLQTQISISVHENESFTQNNSSRGQNVCEWKHAPLKLEMVGSYSQEAKLTPLSFRNLRKD